MIKYYLLKSLLLNLSLLQSPSYWASGQEGDAEEKQRASGTFDGKEKQEAQKYSDSNSYINNSEKEKRTAKIRGMTSAVLSKRIQG